MANRKRNRRSKTLKNRARKRERRSPKTLVMKATLRVEVEAHALCRAMRVTPREAERLFSRVGSLECGGGPVVREERKQVRVYLNGLVTRQVL